MNTYFESSCKTVQQYQTASNRNAIELHELFSILLAEEAEPGLCGRLASKGLDTLSTFTVDDFENFGISTEKSLVLFAHFMLLKKYLSGDLKSKRTLFQIRSPQDVASYVKRRENELNDEIVLLLLNDSNEVMEKCLVYSDTVSGHYIVPGELFKKAVSESAKSIILCRTQQSINTETQIVSDRIVCKLVGDVGKVLGIELQDYVIVEPDKFTSLKAQGFL